MAASPNSLEGLQLSGQIPAFIPESDLIEACNRWGIPATDLSYELNEAQLKGLKNDIKIQAAIRNDKEKKKYEKKAGDLQKLIDKYEALKTSKASVLNAEEVARIDELITKLNEEKAKVTSKSNSIEFDSLESHFENDGNKNIVQRVDSKLAELNGKIAEHYNEQINDAYKELSIAKHEKDNAHSKFKKAISEKKMQRISARIARLKQKQGRFYGNQTRLINKNSDKYIKRMRAKQDKFNREQAMINAQVKNIERINAEAAKLNAEKANLDADISALDTSKLSGRVERTLMEANKKKIESQLRNLKRKQAYCDRRIQHKVVIGRTL